MSEMTKQDLEDLAKLIELARSKNLWLWCRYQDLWFSPDQLAAANAKGSFRWGVINWELREPAERLREAEERARAAQMEVERIRKEFQ